MDIALVELAILLSILLPVMLVLLCILFYANWTTYSKAKIERKKLNSQRTFTRNNRRLFIINSERD